MPDRDHRLRFSRGPAALPFQVQIPLTGGAPGLALPLGGASSPFAFTVPLGTAPPPPAAAPAPTGQPSPAPGAAAAPTVGGAPGASPADAPGPQDAPIVVAGDVPLYQPPEAEALLAEQVLAAAESVAESAAPSPAALLDRLTEAPADFMHSATRLFHALARPPRQTADPLHRHYRERFAIVALPGNSCADIVPRPGDLLLRIAHGEGFAIIAAIAAPGLVPHHRLAALELSGEGTPDPAPGFYVHVIEPGPRPLGAGARFARRLADAGRLVLPDTVLLRLKPAEFAESAAPETLAEAIRTDGPFIRWVQAALNRLTGAGLVEDGQSGPRTRAAVRAFQRAMGLAADGIVGPRTEAALSAALVELQGGGGGAAQAVRCTGLKAREVIDRFAFNGSDVPGAARPQIANIAACIAESRKGANGIDHVTLVGHTDPVGGEAANDALGLRRAETVRQALRDALRDAGVAAADVAIDVETRGKREILPGDPALSRRVEIIPAKPVTPAAAEVAFVLDDDDDKKVDDHAPVATFVRFGIWNHAYDVHGDILNGQNEADNFVGSERRRFYIRVRDPAAATQRVDAKWKTLLADGTTDDDAPASQIVTLTETAAGSHVFVSKALMLVTDDTDAKQDTHSGLNPPLADARIRHRGESNHRLRRARIDGFVFAEYQPASGPAVNVKLPLFQRKPDDERKRLKVRVINYGSHAGAATITGQFDHANLRWNQIGLKIEPGATVDRAIPAAALGADGTYAGEANNGAETAALNDLIPVTPDNTLTVVFVPLPDPPTFNAYATTKERTHVALGDRYFIFIRSDAKLDLENETLAHELAHVLFNRFDGDTARRFYTLNTKAPLGFGVPLPDQRIYRRIQDKHSPDPDTDAARDNIINWARRARGARFPIGGDLDAPTATTGNKLVEAF